MEPGGRITSRHLTKNEANGEAMIFVAVDHLVNVINSERIPIEVDGERQYRLRAHDHPPGSNRRADESNVILLDVSGNQSLIKMQLESYVKDKVSEGWHSDYTPSDPPYWVFEA